MPAEIVRDVEDRCSSGNLKQWEQDLKEKRGLDCHQLGEAIASMIENKRKDESPAGSDPAAVPPVPPESVPAQKPMSEFARSVNPADWSDFQSQVWPWYNDRIMMTFVGGPIIDRDKNPDFVPLETYAAILPHYVKFFGDYGFYHDRKDLGGFSGLGKAIGWRLRAVTPEEASGYAAIGYDHIKAGMVLPEILVGVHDGKPTFDQAWSEIVSTGPFGASSVGFQPASDAVERMAFLCDFEKCRSDVNYIHEIARMTEISWVGRTPANKLAVMTGWDDKAKAAPDASEKAMNIQSIIFEQDNPEGVKWTKDSALAWARGHDYKAYTARTTGSSIRVRQFPPDKCGGYSHKILDEKKGIKAVLCNVGAGSKLAGGGANSPNAINIGHGNNAVVTENPPQSVDKAEKDDKPPKSWWDRCISAVSGNAKDPDKLCGWVWTQRGKTADAGDAKVKGDETVTIPKDLLEELLDMLFVGDADEVGDDESEPAIEEKMKLAAKFAAEGGFTPERIKALIEKCPHCQKFIADEKAKGKSADEAETALVERLKSYLGGANMGANNQENKAKQSGEPAPAPAPDTNEALKQILVVLNEIKAAVISAPEPAVEESKSAVAAAAPPHASGRAKMDDAAIEKMIAEKAKALADEAIAKAKAEMDERLKAIDERFKSLNIQATPAVAPPPPVSTVPPTTPAKPPEDLMKTTREILQKEGMAGIHRLAHERARRP